MPMLMLMFMLMPVENMLLLLLPAPAAQPLSPLFHLAAWFRVIALSIVRGGMMAGWWGCYKIMLIPERNNFVLECTKNFLSINCCIKFLFFHFIACSCFNLKWYWYMDSVRLFSVSVLFQHVLKLNAFLLDCFQCLSCFQISWNEMIFIRLWLIYSWCPLAEEQVFSFQRSPVNIICQLQLRMFSSIAR